ncbi:MAG TPA: hypothetical protein VLN48_14280 [Bryobacteraceae bacterium]|nr:hypothetical protein [Bryobacteraceae bacterium]
MNRKFAIAVSTYAVLALLAFFTLDGTIRLATWIFLGAFAFKTWLVVLKDRQD